MRLFFATPLPVEATSILKVACEGLKTGWKLMPPEQMHVTLLFLGEVSAGALPELREAGRAAVKAVPSFTARLGGTGYFPPLGRPRVWFARAEGEGFEPLAMSLRTSLPSFDMGERFKAHITLARRKSPAPRVGPLLFNQPFEVREFSLIESHLEAGGAVHRTLEYFPLRGE